MKLLFILALLIVSTFTQIAQDFVGVYNINRECQKVCPKNQDQYSSLQFRCPKEGNDRLKISEYQIQGGDYIYHFALQAQKNHWWQWGKKLLRYELFEKDDFSTEPTTGQMYLTVQFMDGYFLNMMKCPATYNEKFPECYMAQQDNPGEEVYIAWKDNTNTDQPVQGCSFTLVKQPKIVDDIFVQRLRNQNLKQRSHQFVHKHKSIKTAKK